MVAVDSLHARTSCDRKLIQKADPKVWKSKGVFRKDARNLKDGLNKFLKEIIIACIFINSLKGNL